MIHVKYLILGGGTAGSAAAEAIRQLDPGAELMLIGQEISRPYHRPFLSRQFLRGEFGRENVFSFSDHWFTEHRVQFRSGRRAVRLDTERSSVMLNSADEISFDRLLIATGGSAAPLNVEGAELPNLYYLRTLEDAERLRMVMSMGRAQSSSSQPPRLRKVVVIGAGLLGMEIAASFSRGGLDVEIVTPAQWPWIDFAGQTVGQFGIRLLQKYGVGIRCNAPVSRLDGDGRVQRIVLASGDAIKCDFAVAAVGMRPNIDLLRGTTIAAEQAILVDERCRTSSPDIYAAGDCAAIFDPRVGKHRVLAHWRSAQLSGRIAGTNMAGGDMKYDAVSFFDTEIFGVPIGIWGGQQPVDRRVVRNVSFSLESPQFIELGIDREDHIVQAIAVGRQDDGAILERWISQSVTVRGVEERFKDPSIPLDQIQAGD